MAFAFARNIANNSSTTTGHSSLTLTFSTINPLNVGELGVILIAVDNTQTTDGDENAISSVTDPQGNTWLKAAEFTNGQGAAAAGATCSIWYTVATAQLSGKLVTIHFSNAINRSCATAAAFTISAASSVAVEGASTLANDASDPGSLDVTTANVECLRIRAIASELDSTTALTKTASFDSTFTQRVTVGGVSSANQGIRGEYKISTGTNAASDPTLFSADHASVYVAFSEVTATSIAVGQASEIDVSFSATAQLGSIEVGQSSETDQAFSVSGQVSTLAIGLTTEADSAFDVAAQSNVTGQASETDSAFSVGIQAGAIAVGLASGTNIAQPISFLVATATTLADYFLNSRSNYVLLELLEISHPNFTQVYRIVRNARGGVTVRLEDATSRLFVYYPTKITRGAQADDLNFSIQADFGDLGEIVPAEIDAVRAADGFGTKPTIKFRVYRSDDLQTVLDGPFILEAEQFACDGRTCSFRANAPQLNIIATGEVYSLERFPMLRGLMQ